MLGRIQLGGASLSVDYKADTRSDRRIRISRIHEYERRSCQR